MRPEIIWLDVQIFAAFFGVIKGYVQLNLGFLVTFEDMRSNFHQASRHYAKATRPRAPMSMHHTSSRIVSRHASLVFSPVARTACMFLRATSIFAT